ncbi:MAG: diguanylate cyclase [Lactobacillus sp.]|nr:diguanylate cyclase [Lactobacillus sp.]
MRLIETNLLMMEISLISHNYEGVMYYLYQSWMLAQDQNNKMLEQYILYLGAMAYYAEERYEGTFELLRIIDKNMYDIDPMGYLYFLINSFYQLHGYDASLKFLNEIVEQEPGAIDDYYDLLTIDLLISEGHYEEAQKLLETVEVDKHSKLWRKTLELEIKRNLNVDIDLYSEYEALLAKSRTGALPTVSVYFIYSHAKDYLSQIRGTSVPYASEFHLDQEYLEEPSFEDIDQLMQLKDASEKKQMRKIVGLILMVVGILGSGYVYQRRLISRLKKEIEHSKKIDVLTQSLSYEWLDEEIHSLIKEYETLQVMLFDLKSLQKYNDTYGYMAGNRVLRQVVELLKSTFDEGFVVRYNGHQFIVMLFDQEACIHDKMNQAIEDFRALDIRFNTGTTKGQLLMKASGLSYQLSNHFDLDGCLKEVQRHMKSLNGEDE